VGAVVERVVSGGQSGVDRAALDVALELGVPCGGWCPKGRRAEDGRIAERYPLLETPAAEYTQRTEWNVHDSDGTLVFTRGTPRGGTAYTLSVARATGKPHLHVDLAAAADPDLVRRWIAAERIRVLNVAGPRESDTPGIGAAAAAFLRRVLGEPAG
jgi:hypothetical protein